MLARLTPARLALIHFVVAFCSSFRTCVGLCSGIMVEEEWACSCLLNDTVAGEGWIDRVGTGRTHQRSHGNGTQCMKVLECFCFVLQCYWSFPQTLSTDSTLTRTHTFKELIALYQVRHRKRGCQLGQIPANRSDNASEDCPEDCVYLARIYFILVKSIWCAMRCTLDILRCVKPLVWMANRVSHAMCVTECQSAIDWRIYLHQTDVTVPPSPRAITVWPCVITAFIR